MVSRFRSALFKFCGAVTLVLSASACAPVYWLGADSPADAVIRSQLDGVLESRGYDTLPDGNLELSDPIGCDQSAPYRRSFFKVWRDRGWLERNHQIRIHEFSCNGRIWIVVVSDSWSTTEQRAEVDELKKAFSRAVPADTIQVHKSYRLALE